MEKVFLWIWCFPQMLAGLLVKTFTKAKKVDDHYEYSIKCGSLSLGEYRFLCPGHYGNNMIIKHEYGHTVQSRYLGWFYLFVIAIPSIIWAGCFEKFRKKHNVSYYSFYTEKWANKLGGVMDIE